MTYRQEQHSLAAMMRSIGRAHTGQVLAVLALTGCTGMGSGTLEGTATYRERIALPPDAVFEAVLQVESRTEAAADVLGSAMVDPAGQPPFRFRITYDKAAIQPGRRYAVRATIKQQERLLFATDRGYPVPEGSDAPLEILLVAADMGRRPVGLRNLPASYEREIPGASSLIRWHLDLLPESRYQLRTTYLDEPKPNQFDRVGRWQYDRNNGRLEVHRSGEPSLYFTMEQDGSALHQLDVGGKPLESRLNQP